MSSTVSTGWVIALTPPEWRRWLLSDTPQSRWQARAGRTYLGWAAFARNPLAMLGLLIVLVLIGMAIFAPLITAYSPVVSGDTVADRFLPPGGDHWLGTDGHSWDIFSRIVYGSRTSLLIIFMVAITAAPVGIIIGTTAGYLGGWVDTALMRLTDTFLALPKLVLALAFAGRIAPVTIDTREIDRHGATYTVETLRDVRSELGPDASIVFVMGADQLQKLDTWRDWRDLFALANFGVAARPGYRLDDAALPAAVALELAQRRASFDDVRASPAGKVCLAHTLAIDISATQVRAALHAVPRTDISALVAPQVLDYIQQHNLYKS